MQFNQTNANVNGNVYNNVPDKVYLVTCGDGTDGDEWIVESIHISKDHAEAFIVAQNMYGYYKVEEWELKK